VKPILIITIPHGQSQKQLPGLITTTSFLFAEPSKYVGAAIMAGTFGQDKIIRSLSKSRFFKFPLTMRYAALED
jgi:hypothetical protein